jgi:hypothetical protein
MYKNTIILKLKSVLDEIELNNSFTGLESKRNALKEELQYYVLDCIYNHPEYKEWVMYGGSALRICHGLDRMSVDLDFEISEHVSNELLEKLKLDICTYFESRFGSGDGFLSIKISGSRGLRLNFHIGQVLGLGHSSDQVHVKVDLNFFTAPKISTERIPVNHNQLSFVIKTYNMSNLMASKIAAIFLRGDRVVGKSVFGEKGRDIYDLLWYMGKGIIPDLDYIKAKGIDVSNLSELLHKLTIKMNNVSQRNLEDDLKPLFIDSSGVSGITDWLKNWFQTYLHLLKSYPVRTVTELIKFQLLKDFHTDNYSFVYDYKTTEGDSVRFIASATDECIDINGDIPIDVNMDVLSKMSQEVIKVSDLGDDIKKIISLFYEKIEKYLKKTKREVVGRTISTKLLRVTATNFNPVAQMIVTKSFLLNAEFDDLMK